MRINANADTRPCTAKYKSKAMDVAAMTAVIKRSVLDFTWRHVVFPASLPHRR